MNAWDEDERHHRYGPHLFTTEEWATVSPNARELIRRQRMSVVEALALDHERRYHSPRHLVALDMALHGE